MSITVELSHNIETLEALQYEWIDLQNRSTSTGAALAWYWIYIWYKHNKSLGELWLMEAREDNRLIGIAPFMKVEEKPDWGFAWQQIRFINAFTIEEHLDFIIEPGYEEQVIPMFIDKLYEHKSQWDVINLTGFCDTKTIDILQQSNRNWTEDIEESRIVPYMTLPDTVDEWMQSISSNHRQKLRRYKRKLDKQFPDRWLISQATQPDELDDAFEHLVHLHQTYWEDQGYPGHFNRGEWVECYRELLHGLLENGWLRLYRLDIDDEPCAVNYFFHYRGRAYFVFGGLKRGVTEIPLGYVLLQHNIEQAINEGLPEYNFMLGEQSYKFSFGGVAREHRAFQLIGNPRVPIQIKTVDLLRRTKTRIHIRSRIEWIKSRLRTPVPVSPDDEVSED